MRVCAPEAWGGVGAHGRGVALRGHARTVTLRPFLPRVSPRPHPEAAPGGGPSRWSLRCRLLSQRVANPLPTMLPASRLYSPWPFEASMRGSIYNSRHMDHAGFLAQTYAGRHSTARRSCSPPPQPHTQRKVRPELPRPCTVVPSTPGSQGLGGGCRRRDPAIRGDLQSRLAQRLPREGPRAPLLPIPAEYRPVCGWGIASRGTEPVSPTRGGGRPPVQARGNHGPGQVPPPQGTWDMFCTFLQHVCVPLWVQGCPAGSPAPDGTSFHVLIQLADSSPFLSPIWRGYGGSGHAHEDSFSTPCTRELRYLQSRERRGVRLGPPHPWLSGGGPTLFQYLLGARKPVEMEPDPDPSALTPGWPPSGLHFPPASPMLGDRLW